jgi:taurine transport system permease protein
MSNRLRKPNLQLYPQLRYMAISLLSVFALLLAWHLITDVFRFFSPTILPSPRETVNRFFWLLENRFMGATLLGHTLASMQIVLIAWVLSILVGIPLGILLAWFPTLDKLIYPLFQLLRPIPPIAWIPLSIVWFGIEAPARIFVVLMAAFPPCVLNAYEGVRSIDPLLVNAARTLGAKDRSILFDVIVPTSIPLLITGTRISLGNAWMTMVAAELLAARVGIGFIMQIARRTLQPTIIFSAMAVIGLLGAAFSYALNWAGTFLTPWQVNNGK